MSNIKKCCKCNEELVISEFLCPACSTTIRGSFEIEDSSSMFGRFTDEERYFILVFLQCAGVIQDVEKVMGISYPTVKAKLKDIQRKLEGNGFSESEGHFEKQAFKREMHEMKDRIRRHIRIQLREGLKSGFMGSMSEGDEDDECETHHADECRCDSEDSSKETETTKPGAKVDVKDVLDKLESGEIDVQSAISEIKKFKK